MDIDPKALCRQAAEVIRTRGHAKCNLESYTGSVCLFGAVNIAHHGDAQYRNLGGVQPEEGDCFAQTYYGKVAALIAPFLPDDAQSYSEVPHRKDFERAIHFNNAPKTTSEQVIDMLEKAAA